MIDSPVALVTGTSRGIGRGIAEHMLNLGYIVAGCSRGPSTVESENYVHAELDITEEAEVRNWVLEISQSYGRIDLVVNNAGIGTSSLVLGTSTESARSAVETNFLGAFSVCREASKAMLTKHSGRLINISSIAIGLHMKGAASYASSKAALVEFSKILAKELGPTGITCNVIAVSLVESDMSANLTDDACAYYSQNLAFDRWATIDDIANAVSFFASPESGYITGQVLNLGFVD